MLKPPASLNRRPLRSRDSPWAHALAERLVAWGVAPDTVSAAGLAIALAGGAALAASGLAPVGARPALLLAAAVAMQLRLICNLLDGMIAIEHGRAGPLGPVWNEAPDRLADCALLVGAGYGAALAGAAWAEPLGWSAALFAVGTAYLRELGRALGFASDYGGPGSKPRRMHLLSLAAIASGIEPLILPRGATLGTGLAVIAAACILTLILRTRRLARGLISKAGA